MLRAMRSALCVLGALLLFCSSAVAQWTLQDSHTSAGLRGIHSVSVDGVVAWASGTNGTILRTDDGGSHWQTCAVPPGGEKLDFRGVWAWDASAAIVLASGPGEQSRVYKTTDGCSHWSESIKNDKKDGFWDAVVFQSRDFGMLGDGNTGMLLGDPVNSRFDMYAMPLGHGWLSDDAACLARKDESAFAASNSAVFVFGSRRYIIVTGGRGGPRALLSPLLVGGVGNDACVEAGLPLASGSDSSGTFSVSFKDLKHGIAVGGDYKHPEIRSGTAAWTSDGGRHWTAASTLPNGYRSGVGWDSALKVWIAVGTNGADVSTDDGKTWKHLDRGNWNAISPPYAVGPRGRIGKLASVK